MCVKFREPKNPKKCENSGLKLEVDLLQKHFPTHNAQEKVQKVVDNFFLLWI